MEAKFKDPAARLKRVQDQVATQHHLSRGGGGGEDDKSSQRSHPQLSIKQGSVQGPPSRQGSLTSPLLHSQPNGPTGHGSASTSPPLPIPLTSPSAVRQGHPSGPQPQPSSGPQPQPSHPTQRQVSSAESLTPPPHSPFGRSPSFESQGFTKGDQKLGPGMRTSGLFPPLQPSPNRSSTTHHSTIPSTMASSTSASAYQLTRNSAGPMLGTGTRVHQKRDVDEERSETGSMRSAVSEGPTHSIG